MQNNHHSSIRLFNRLNIVLILLVLINVVNMLFPKGQGIELQHRWEDEIAYALYAGVITLMAPSLSSKIRYFASMRYMSFVIVSYIIYAYAVGDKYNQNVVIRTFMIACSFVFFEEQLRKQKMNVLLCRVYVLSLFAQYSLLIITENRLVTALLNDHTEGGQSLANSLVLILPLVFYLFKGKISVFLYVIGIVIVFISLRRSAIIAYFLVIPFVYKQMSNSFSQKFTIIVLVFLCLIVYYIISKYWMILEMRFSNLYEANSNGDYGSGRTGWLSILLKEYLLSPEHWLQGFGLGSVAKFMASHGYPYGHAHNGYVEILFTYGLIGFCLWFYVFIKIGMTANKYVTRTNTKLLLYLCSFLYLFISIMSGTTDLPSVLAISLCTNMVFYNNGGLKKTVNNNKKALN